MAQNITLLGANYSAVPAVTLPKTGGGTAKFTDVTDTTAAASDVASGKYFYDTNGTRTQGTASGGGSDIPTFTIVWYDDYSDIKEVVCDKTYQQVLNYVNDSNFLAFCTENDESGLQPSSPAPMFLTWIGALSGEYIRGIVSAETPYAQINYYQAGEITISYDDIDSLKTLNVTQNGTYTPDYGEVFNEVIVNVSGGSPTIQSLTVTPTTSQQTFNSGSVDGYKPVVVNAMPSGTAGTPTATKGTVSNHSVSVTPSVTNTTGYITGSTKTGTAVTVSASELVSGSETKTANGTYDVTNLASLVVNVSGGSSKNAQTAQSTSRSASSTYTECISLTCSKSGTYHVYWSTFRSSTSGTWGSQLYLNDTAYGTAQTGSWSNHIQNIHLTNVQIDANEEVAVRVRTRGNSYYGYVGTLTIIEA